MPSSRQDQLHSYQYSQQRVVSALVTHDPDPSRSPLRRAGSAALVSLLVAAIAVGGVAAYALITGNKKVDPRKQDVVFVEKESGAQYVYYKEDDRLHPVLNFTSGLLIAGSSGKASTSNVARKALAGVQLGAPMGIPSAPDSLPSAKDLMKDPWTICSILEGTGPAKPTKTLLMVGERPTDGRVPATTVGAKKGETLLISDPANTIFLLYGNRKFRIPPDKVEPTKTAFGWNDQRPIPVSAAFINAVPGGRDLVPPTIQGWGNPSIVPEAAVGVMLHTFIDEGRRQLWAIAMEDGVADLTEIQAKQLMSDPATKGRVGASRQTEVTDFARLPRSDNIVLTGADALDGQPTWVPDLLTASQRVCLTTEHRADGGEAEVRIDPTVPTGIDVGGKSSSVDGARVDAISVPRGRGVLVEAAASPGAPLGTGTISLVLDTGIRYPLASPDVPAMLGYGQVKPVQYPGGMVALLPVGPALDPVEARKSRLDAD